MMEKFTVTGTSQPSPLSVAREGTQMFIEMGEGDGLLSIAFDCADDAERKGLQRFLEAANRMATDAFLFEYDTRHNDDEEPAEL